MSIDWDKVYKIAHRLYWIRPDNNRHILDRDDAVQEAMLRCWKYRNKWEGRETCYAFFGRVILWCFRELIHYANRENRNRPPGVKVLSIDYVVEVDTYDHNYDFNNAANIYEDCRIILTVDTDEVRRLRDQRILQRSTKVLDYKMLAGEFGLSVARIGAILVKVRKEERCKNKTH